MYWEILLTQDTYDAALEARNCEKYATTLTAESGIPADITGEARVVYAFEIMREQLGQDCSRYPRSRVRWNHMDSEELRSEGLFYSALIRLYFDLPGLL